MREKIANFSLNLQNSVAIVPLVGYVAGFCTSLFMNNTNQLLGRKVSSLCSYLSCLILVNNVWF